MTEPNIDFKEKRANAYFIGFYLGEYGTYFTYFKDKFEIKGIEEEEVGAFFKSKADSSWHDLIKWCQKAGISLNQKTIEEERTNPLLVFEDNKSVRKKLMLLYGKDFLSYFDLGEELGGEFLWCMNMDGDNLKSPDLWKMKYEQLIDEKYEHLRTKLSPIENIISVLENAKEGHSEERKKLEEKILDLNSYIFQGNEVSKQKSKKIFIIHGHDDVLKLEIARFVEKLGFESVILHEVANMGRHIFEKFEEEATNALFAIALLSPDDETNQGTKRARQNVIFEMGYFLGKLGRGKIILIKKGKIEIPSDLHGVIYINYDGQWQSELQRELIDV